MTGGDGDDRYIVDNVADKTVETSTGGTDTVDATVDWTLMSYTENLNLLGAATLTGHGNNLSNIVIGNSGNNLLVWRIGQRQPLWWQRQRHAGWRKRQRRDVWRCWR